MYRKNFSLNMKIKNEAKGLLYENIESFFLYCLKSWGISKMAQVIVLTNQTNQTILK